MIFSLFRRCCRSTSAVQPTVVPVSGDSVVSSDSVDSGVSGHSAEPKRWRPSLPPILEGDETESDHQIDHQIARVSHAWSLNQLLKRFR
ncbi:unnamed protein product [Arabidopsis lyrata]|uniref:Uncharacterized protein n=1 Tax=Arabidopsis lyrata subsp. lyrata TaxID=81972 RepID=D7LEW8_ARALL|nr:uncharacterized protein LOC9315446 [Arabidopsis lyrata subsp. lyrata]EFH55638.1 hypothetical protein ARALYDRAFT_902278 [Arabidopsis lyrata subsp. lyrata]CAH8264464.1 unnamed protein product [Arabidopsis lyrata]|eukprot:XP_020883099.1 uncharacterized protein LOC9315446 [Arabidopsis lyrata subsp. lyrata]